MLSYIFVIILLFYSCDFSVVFGQVTQQVFVAEEWVHNARNKANAEALSYVDVEKSLRALNKNKLSYSRS